MNRIGVVGVGFIGKILIDGLTQADYDVVAYDIDPAERSHITDLGEEWAESPAAVAQETDAVIIAVPGAPEVLDVFEGDDGILGTLDEDQIVIDTSTTGPDAAETVAELSEERGFPFLTAPLTANAPAGGVRMMVGGSEAAYETGSPLLDAMSDRHRRIGTVAEAQTFKLILQARYACQDAVDAEIVAFARDQGLDPRPYHEFLGLDIDEKYLDRDFSPSIEGMGTLAIWHKDLGYGLDVAKESDTATPIINAVFEAYKHAFRTVSPDEGYSTTILRYWEALNDR